MTVLSWRVHVTDTQRAAGESWPRGPGVRAGWRWGLGRGPRVNVVTWKTVERSPVEP